MFVDVCEIHGVVVHDRWSMVDGRKYSKTFVVLQLTACGHDIDKKTAQRAMSRTGLSVRDNHLVLLRSLPRKLARDTGVWIDLDH